MNHLRLRTEYSFRYVYGRIHEVIDQLHDIRLTEFAAITDRGTWGHVNWWKACKKAGIHPILGVEIMVVPQPEKRERQRGPTMAFLATTENALAELHRLTTWSNKSATEESDSGGFYYYPRIGYEMVNECSSDLIVLSGVGADLGALQNRSNVWLEMNPENQPWNRRVRREKGWQSIVCASNQFPATRDKEAYEILTGRNRRDRIGLAHIPSKAELLLAVPTATEQEIEATKHVASLVKLDELPQASMISKQWPKTLGELCEEGKSARSLDGDNWTEIYDARLRRELELIEEKGFVDYFQVIGRMVTTAKRSMMVGPARGSAAGSLVCYLMRITNVDPLIHGLMFERFIDVTRADLPDVDIDFPDTKRDDVIAQLTEDWGTEHVGRIGTVSRYKPRSALGDVAKELGVPPWEINNVKDIIEERSSGDERAEFAVADALQDTEEGMALLKAYPGMMNAGRIEGHARHSGMHAAGVLVTERPISHFASVDKSGACQLDKKDAEAFGMLKIDCLSLRTLSVIEDALEQIGKDADWLVHYPLDDTAAFEVFNQERFAGVFQFEGYTLQTLCRLMKIREFSDISALTALCRPGPLNCGASMEFVERRLGKKRIESVHPLMDEATADSYGTMIYQEQVMTVCRTMGQFSWEDVTAIRKIMSKSLGDEFFAKYWKKFLRGAKRQGVSEKDAKAVWDKMRTFGSWAFNKSHTISYGLISYWCAVLKAHYPLEFGAACLRNAGGDDQSLHVLRELVEEGYEYTPVDPERSGLTWEVIDGKLVGGLMNIKGIGPAKAQDIIERRKKDKPMPPGLLKLLRKPSTPFDHVFEARERFQHIYDDPRAHGITSGPLTHVADIQEEGEYVFIAKLRERKLRDENEARNLARRGGRKIKGRTKLLHLVLEDDTGTIVGKINRHNYPKWGSPIVDQMKIGDYLLFKGRVRSGWRIVYIDRWRYLEKIDRSKSEKGE
jgi:DNA polymerase III alpha subunit